MNDITPGTDPWSPVQTWQDHAEEDVALEVHGGAVTAHINLGGDTKPVEQEPTEAEKMAADDSGTEEEDAAEEVEAAEQTLAEKLAALDAVKPSAKKTKK